jgi:hypothetical protein
LDTFGGIYIQKQKIELISKEMILYIKTLMNAENKEIKRCSKCGCKKLLKFFKVRESTGLLYKTCIKCCKKPDSRICFCGKHQPSFGFENDKKATCCSGCKQEGMINITNKKCPCGKRPSFGFEEDKTATCCTVCKKDGMIDIKHKKCLCGKRPYFGFENDKKATCCKDCKKEGMFDITNKKCICGKVQPVFGFENDKIATSCKECKQEGMINFRIIENIKDTVLVASFLHFQTKN